MKMEITVGARQSGKTGHLIDRACNDSLVIVCANSSQVIHLKSRMQRDKRKDKFLTPLTYRQFLAGKRNDKAKGYLIDDAEYFFRHISGQIVGAAFSPSALHVTNSFTSL